MSDRAPAIALGLAACVGLMAAALRSQRRHPKMRIHFSDHDSYPNTPHLASLPEGPRTAADANILGRLGADGSMVTKEDLLARVWSRLHVSEEYLKTKISALRKTLGKDRHFIRTEIGPGYRFTVVGWRPPGRRPRARWMSVLQSFSRCFHANVDLSAPSRSRLFKALALMAALGLSTVAPAHAAPGAGSSIVQGLYDALLGTMKNGRTLGESGRFAQLAPVIRRSFDVALMARLSVGPLWAGLSEAQRQALTESYGRYISAIYADRFDSYHGQKLEVTGEQPAPFGLLVKTRITKSNGEPVEVDYLLRRSGANWLISDVYLDSTISEVATRRSEFAAILEAQGVDGLIAALNRKADILSGTTARFS